MFIYFSRWGLWCRCRPLSSPVWRGGKFQALGYEYRRTHKQATYSHGALQTHYRLTACGQIALTIYHLFHLSEMCALLPPTLCLKTSCYFSYRQSPRQTYSKHDVINIFCLFFPVSVGSGAKNVKETTALYRQLKSSHTQLLVLTGFDF